jgi:hypothetical protein
MLRGRWASGDVPRWWQVRKTGYVPDPFGYQRAPFAMLAKILSLGGESPPRHHVPMLPPCMDQGDTNSCTGHAVSVVLTPFLGWVPSPVEIYRNGRAIDRSSPEEALLDRGARPNEVFRAVNEYGVRPMKSPALDGRLSDAEPATINDEPMLGDLQEEALTVLVGQYGIYSSGIRRGEEVRAALAADKPICAAIAGGSPKFQSYQRGILTPLRARLDHYIVLTGYDTLTVEGQRVYRGRNSWSTQWGEQGDFWIDEDALNELGDLVVADVRRKP